VKSIAIVGAGSIGLYYGGKLAAHGHDVRFLLRSGFAEAKERGIHIFSDGGDIHLGQPQVFERPEEIGPCDLAIVTLKATANRHVATLIPPLLHKTTSLLTLQNGLGGDEALAELFGAERVMGGLCFVCLTRRSPASVDHIGHGAISIGEFHGAPQPRTEAIVEALRGTGIKANVVEDLATERWRKLSWNIPFNGLGVAENVTTDQVLSDPRLHAECRALMEEVIAAANALGHPIEREYADFQIERTYAMGAYQPSTLVDWREGRELEIAPIWEEPLRKARAAGISMPHLERLSARLKAASLRRL